MYKVTSIYPHQDKIKVEWNLGKRCNYDCAYCPSEIHDNVSPHTDINMLYRAVDKLVATGDIRLSFTGGEPCVHPMFGELVSYAKSSGIKFISVTTNGTRRSDYYVALDVDQYVFSLHFEPDWRRVLDTIIEVHKTSHRYVMVNLMAHQDKMDLAKEAVALLTLSNVPYVVRRIRWSQGVQDVFNDEKYTTDDLDWIISNTATVKPNTIIDDVDKYHANDIIKLHLNKYHGWKCNAGIESLMINWDGDVHRATCRVGGVLGNIYKGSFFQNPEPVICTREYCTCAADIPLTKVNVTTPEIPS
jgi:MoaA/NifB/PqqE/SkfB family radical SAM enzyme